MIFFKELLCKEILCLFDYDLFIICDASVYRDGNTHTIQSAILNRIEY